MSGHAVTRLLPPGLSGRTPTGAPADLLPVAVGLAALVVGGLAGVEPALGVLAAVGLAFVALVLADVFLGLAAMMLLAFLETLSTLGGVSLAKLAGVVIAMSWLAALTIGRRRARNLLADRPGLSYLLLLFLAWNTISLLWSADRGAAIDSVTRYALNIVLIPIVFTAVRDRRDATRALGVLVAGAAIAALWGIVNPAEQTDVGVSRATGAAGDPNELAAGLIVGLAVAVAFAVDRHLAVRWRALSGAAVALCLLGVLMTLSRGGLIGLGAAVVTAILVAGRWRRQILTAAFSVALVAVTYFAFFVAVPEQQRVLDAGGGTGRVDLWTVGGRMVEDNLLRGVGAGQFPGSSVHYLLQPGAIERGDFFLLDPKVAHNTYLGIAAEVGMIGALLFGGILLFCVGCLWQAARRFTADRDESMEILARGLLAGLGGYLVTLLFISENYSKLLWILLALGPVLLAVARAGPAGGPLPPGRAPG